MKKIISLILSVALLCACVFTMASCGELKLEGTYSGAFLGYDEDVLKVTIAKDKTVSYELTYGGDKVSAKGSYTLEQEEDHGHEIIIFHVTGDYTKVGMLSLLDKEEYTYSLTEKDGKKVLSLSSHTTYQVMELVEVED